ncbi:MAG: hypothetical protein FD138_3584 [Planctomycetota bacterium]|nr:MAG: hypothetical protein FD138_3584 [Planctomycetota bacterium]
MAVINSAGFDSRRHQVLSVKRQPRELAKDSRESEMSRLGSRKRTGHSGRSVGFFVETSLMTFSGFSGNGQTA